MTDMLFFVLDRTFFITHLVIICSIFMIPLEKRTHAVIRAIVGLFGVFIISLFFPHTQIKYIIETFAAAAFVWMVCDITPQDALYCAICSYVTQHFARTMYTVVFKGGTGIHVTPEYALCCIVTYVGFYWMFARKLPEDGHYDVDIKRSLLSFGVVIIFADLLSSIAGANYRIEGDSNYIITTCYAMLCCVYAMWTQLTMKEKVKADKELEVQKQLWLKNKSQYEQSQSNIEIINMKCHDLKKQIEVLRAKLSDEDKKAYIDQLEHSVQIYDASIETGSPVLDTVLTEKSLFCEQNEINMTCVADGSRLGFMDAIDVYTIFGNALDNAIECVSEVEDREKRIISVCVWSKSDLLMIQIDNYNEKELGMKDGLPITHKPDTSNHGFGVKSIRYTVERYDGSMGIYLEDNIFSLRISIPLPQ